MGIYKITYKASNQKLYALEVFASSGYNARDSFVKQEILPGLHEIIRIDDVSDAKTEQRVNAIMNGLTNLVTASKDPEVKKIAIFKKPIAALATLLFMEHKHLLDGASLTDIPTAAKKIFNHVVGNK